MVELKSIGATIAVSDYSNIQPVIETDNLEDGLKYLHKLSMAVGNNAYADKIKSAGSSNTSEIAKLTTLTAINGEQVNFCEANHSYWNGDKKLLSGSKFASMMTTKFDAERIAGRMAKDGLKATDIIKLWKDKNQVACDFGSSVHKAMEIYQRYNIYRSILGGEEKVLPNSPYISDIVKNFFTPERKDEKAVPEAFVVDIEDGLCGVVDRLVFLDKDTKTISIQDFKTNDVTKKVTFTKEIRELYPDIDKNKIGEYKFQLSFYAYILKKNGYNVKDCKLFVLNDTEWEEISFKPLDITPALLIVKG